MNQDYQTLYTTLIEQESLTPEEAKRTISALEDLNNNVPGVSADSIWQSFYKQKKLQYATI